MSAQSKTYPTREQLAQFVAFYEDDYSRLVWLLIRAGASREEAEDTAQTAMHMALKNWPSILSPKTFVRTVATRTLYRGWETTKRENHAWQRITQDIMVATFDANEDVEEAVRMLQALPDAQRLAFTLHHDGYEYADIAEITGQHRDTVRSNIRHAREKLARMLNIESTRKEATHGP